MDTIRNGLKPLEEIPANRQLVEALYARGKITPEARAYALDLLYPARHWGLWVSRLFAGLGATLVLAGILYFYAFNWAAITGAIKLGTAEFALVACMAGALWRGLETTGGKFFALATAVLAGVFLAVFGQVYQTGADAWELFAAWAVLILPFGVAACFAPIWGLWLVVANLGLLLFWEQLHPMRFHVDTLIYPVMGVFNTLILAAREVAEKRLRWLSTAWTRNLPALLALICAVVPMLVLILDWRKDVPEDWAAATVGAAILSGFYIFYRYVKTDVHMLAGTMLAACVVAEAGLFRLMNFHHADDAGMLLLIGVVTLALFGGVIAWLRNLSKQLEVSPWMKH
jgi:uncharacterized membrane protein